jgi:D-arginine dehydrogenase
VSEPGVDVCVVGGGMAGACIAAHLAAEASVVLVERERTVAYHTTGRSAAAFIESYGPPAIRHLTVASRTFFVEHGGTSPDRPPLLLPRPVLMVGDEHQVATLEAAARLGRRFVAEIQLLAPQEAIALCPVLEPSRLAGGVLDPNAQDIDVAAVLDVMLAQCRAAGGTVRTSSELVSLERDGAAWAVHLSGGRILRATTVVDAAGAWGDELGRRAGAAPVGLQPRRRTALLVPGPGDHGGWPLVVDVDERWYFKPEGPNLLCSPADETPVEPCDARPEELDVALAIDRVNTATTLGIRHVRRSWAGLRTFSPDGNPVVGFDTEVEGFFWFVGQGGYGIQTAPAMGRLGAALVLGHPAPSDLADAAADVVLTPDRRAAFAAASPPAPH